MGVQSKFRVTGMTCDHCARRVKEALESLDSVLSAEISVERAEALVTHDGNLSPDVALGKIRDAGYEGEAED